MTAGFSLEKDSNNIATLTMDMAGSVNTMNQDYLQHMGDALEALQGDEELAGVVLASAKSTFFAGGDLNYLKSIKPGREEQAFAFIENLKHQLRHLETLGVPVVAAINGAALGGGWELCLACHRRIALPNAKVGLPEVTLGLLPGAGGVVRSVNLLGLQTALPLLLEGKQLKAAKAAQLGLVHELVEEEEQLVLKAKEWILVNSDNPQAAQQPWDQEGFRLPGGKADAPKNAQFTFGALASVHKKTRGLMPAPKHIVDVAVEAARLPFDRALVVESRHLTHLVTTPVAKNLINTFFFQLNQVNGGGSRPAIEQKFACGKVGVLGAGMMGQGIAYVAAKAGIEVVLKDVSQESADKGKAYSAKLMDKAIARGRADDAKKEALLSLITATDQSDALQGCDLIIEAVFEDMQLKHKLTRELEPQLAEDGVWGSNTSTLPITQLADASQDAEKFIGIHFFSPVDKMPLVELICGKATSDETLAKAFDFVRQIGKTPIVVNDSVGFFTSRTFEAQLNEGAQLVAEGVHPQKVDSLGAAIGMPVGPLTVTDEVSLQLMAKIRKTQFEMGLRDPADDQTPEGTAVREFLIGSDRLGRQYGGGYFDYSDEGKSIWPELIARYHKPELAISDQDIKDRLLFSSVIETLKCLQEGVLTSVADANIGSIFGIGAPQWTGGYVQFINTYGLDRFIQRCDELSELYGERFNAPQIVRDYLAAGKVLE